MTILDNKTIFINHLRIDGINFGNSSVLDSGNEWGASGRIQAMEPCSKRRLTVAPKIVAPKIVAPKIVALTDLASLRAAGIAYPDTEHAWRWLYRKRVERGLDAAFMRQGRRILVNVELFIKLMTKERR